MNLMKNGILILTFWIIANISFCQSKRNVPYFKFPMDTTITPQQKGHLTNYPSLPVYLGVFFSKNNYIGLNSTIYQELCVQGKSYFKFTLEPNGILKNIVAIKGTPTFFVEIFKEGINTTKNLWIFPKESPSNTSIDIVLPFEYNCLLGCKRGLKNEHLNIDNFPKILTSNELQFENGAYLRDFHYFLEPYQIDATGDY
jgi:hypothetical protein